MRGPSIFPLGLPPRPPLASQVPSAATSRKLGSTRMRCTTLAVMFGYGLFVVLALLTGVVIAVQTGVNTQLRSYLGSPLQAVFISFLVGLVIVALALVGKREAPPFAKLMHMPWWM